MDGSTVESFTGHCGGFALSGRVSLDKKRNQLLQYHQRKTFFITQCLECNKLPKTGHHIFRDQVQTRRTHTGLGYYAQEEEGTRTIIF